jgi:hypothetical protein
VPEAIELRKRSFAGSNGRAPWITTDESSFSVGVQLKIGNQALRGLLTGLTITTVDRAQADLQFRIQLTLSGLPRFVHHTAHQCTKRYKLGCYASYIGCARRLLRWSVNYGQP